MFSVESRSRSLEMAYGAWGSKQAASRAANKPGTAKSKVSNPKYVQRSGAPLAKPIRGVKTKKAVEMPRVRSVKHKVERKGISGSADPKWWASLTPAEKKKIIKKMQKPPTRSA
jgi:hypothetical protein